LNYNFESQNQTNSTVTALLLDDTIDKYHSYKQQHLYSNMTICTCCKLYNMVFLCSGVIYVLYIEGACGIIKLCTCDRAI